MQLAHPQALQSSCSHARVDVQCFSGDAHAIPTVLVGRKRDLYCLAAQGIANGQFELLASPKQSHGLIKQLEKVRAFLKPSSWGGRFWGMLG